MEQKTEPRNKATHPQSIIFNKGGNNTEWRKDILSLASGVGKAAQPPVNQ